MTLVRMAELTWPECRDLGAREDAFGLIPLGSIEQHGPHLPLATDTLIVERLVEAVAERVPANVIVTPTIVGGLSDHHLGFPGTLSLTPELFSKSIDALLEAFDRMGVFRVALISWHGGNFAFLEEFASERPASDGRLLVAYSNLRDLLATMFDAAREGGVNPLPTDVHAGALETSVALHLFPDKVVGNYRDVTGYTEAREGWMDALFADGVLALSDNGVLGDPSIASARLGRRVFEGVVDHVTGWLVDSLEIEPSVSAPRAAE